MTRLCKQGHEMRDMGQWPKHGTDQVENKFHCPTCKTFEAEDVTGFKLVDDGNGGRQMVAE